MIMFGCARSIFARSTCAPSGNSPAFMRRSRSRFSSTERSRYGPRYARRRHGAAIRADLLLGLRVDVRLPSLHEVLGELVQLLEVVARVELLVPLEAEPLDVALDGLDVLDVFGERVRVVEAQVAAAAELLRDAEVEADRLHVADVREAVRLGREARRDRAAEATGRDVVGDHLSDEVFAGRGRGGVVSHVGVPIGEMGPRKVVQSRRVEIGVSPESDSESGLRVGTQSRDSRVGTQSRDSESGVASLTPISGVAQIPNAMPRPPMRPLR